MCVFRNYTKCASTDKDVLMVELFLKGWDLFARLFKLKRKRKNPLGAEERARWEAAKKGKIG